jgi:hypothetical protein
VLPLTGVSGVVVVVPDVASEVVLDAAPEVVPDAAPEVVPLLPSGELVESGWSGELVESEGTGVVEVGAGESCGGGSTDDCVEVSLEAAVPAGFEDDDVGGDVWATLAVRGCVGAVVPLVPAVDRGAPPSLGVSPRPDPAVEALPALDASLAPRRVSFPAGATRGLCGRTAETSCP